MKTNLIKQLLAKAGKWIVSGVTRNTGLKLLAIALALMLWSYVISSDSDITRTKTHAGLQGYVSGQSSLDTYNLALASDPTEALTNITVEVEVPLSSYSYSTGENVKVQLDLSSVRTAGTQEVPLKATTAYGTVKRIYPSSVTMTFEPRDSRSVPINVQMQGTEDGYWYNCARVNPSVITVYGATSVVQRIATAVVYPDVSERYSSFNTSARIELKDSDGNVIPSSLLSYSSSSASLYIDIYPTKEIDISVNPDDVLIGEVAEGYRIESITIQPGTVTVAADPELLSILDTLIIEPIDIDSPSQSFTRRASIIGLSDLKYISSEQVYVNVQIVEETVGKWYEDIHITFIGRSEGLDVMAEQITVNVRVTGPRSEIEQLDPENISIIVDVTGLGEGEYLLTPVPDSDADTTLTYQIDPVAIKVILQSTDTE